MIIHTQKRPSRSDRKKAYAQYLKSDHWKQLRRRKLDEAKWCCERCGVSSGIFQVHHKVYRTNWRDTELFELEALCEPCHRKEHGLKVRRHGQNKMWSRKKLKARQSIYRSRVARYGHAAAITMTRIKGF